MIATCYAVPGTSWCARRCCAHFYATGSKEILLLDRFEKTNNAKQRPAERSDGLHIEDFLSKPAARP